MLLIFIFFVYTLLQFIWKEYVSLYWYTDVVELYEDENGFRVCGKNKSYMPLWFQNDNYWLHEPKMESAALSGKSITIEARVYFLEDKQEVHLVNIYGVNIEENYSCNQ